MKLLLDKTEVSKEELLAAFQYPLQARTSNGMIPLGNAYVLKARLMYVKDLGEIQKGDPALKNAVALVVKSSVECANLHMETWGEKKYLIVDQMESPIELKYGDTIVDRFELQSNVPSIGEKDYVRAGDEQDLRGIITRQALLVAGITTASPKQLVQRLPFLQNVIDAPSSPVPPSRRSVTA